MTGRIFDSHGDGVPYANVWSIARPDIITSTDDVGNWSAPFQVGEQISVAQVGFNKWSGPAQNAQLLRLSENVQVLPEYVATPRPNWFALGLMIAFAALVDDGDGRSLK